MPCLHAFVAPEEHLNPASASASCAPRARATIPGATWTPTRSSRVSTWLPCRPAPWTATTRQAVRWGHMEIRTRSSISRVPSAAVCVRTVTRHRRPKRLARRRPTAAVHDQRSDSAPKPRRLLMPRISHVSCSISDARSLPGGPLCQRGGCLHAMPARACQLHRPYRHYACHARATAESMAPLRTHRRREGVRGIERGSARALSWRRRGDRAS